MFSVDNSMKLQEFTLILYNLFQKIEKEGRLLNSFYEVSIVLTSEPDNSYKRETIDQYSHEYGRKNS